VSDIDHIAEWKRSLAANLRGNWEAAECVVQLARAVAIEEIGKEAEIERLRELITVARDELLLARERGVDQIDVNEAIDQLDAALAGKGES
jgi:hypothetical protein